jgi:hypothetical protein
MSAPDEVIGWGSTAMDIVKVDSDPPCPDWSYFVDDISRACIVTFKPVGLPVIRVTINTIESEQFEDISYVSGKDQHWAISLLVKRVWRRVSGFDQWAGYHTMWSAMAGREAT